MRAARNLVLVLALAGASTLRADDCALEKAQSLLAARLKDWFSVNNNAWLRDPQRYAALALQDAAAWPDALRDGIVVEVRAPSHGSCVKFLVELDRSGEPRISALEERSCSKRARDESVVSVIVEEKDMRPNDVPMDLLSD